MGFIQIARNITLGLCLLLSLATTAFIVHYMCSSFVKAFDGEIVRVVYSFEILGIVAGFLSLLLLPTMMIGRHSVILDLIAMITFWVLWLTETILVMQHRPKRLGRFRYRRCPKFPLAYNPCYESLLIQNLATALFALNLFYVCALFIYALVSHYTRNPIWTTSIRRLNQPIHAQGPMSAPYYNPTMVSYEVEKTATPNGMGANATHEHVEEVAATPPGPATKAA